MGPLAEEDAGDHEPRDHIEDVDADIAPSQSGDIGVEQHHEHDGNGSQALHVGTKAAISRWSSCLVLGDGRGIDGDRHQAVRSRMLDTADTSPKLPSTFVTIVLLPQEVASTGATGPEG